MFFQKQVRRRSNKCANSHHKPVAKPIFHEKTHLFLPLRSVKRAKCGNWTKNRCFSEASVEEEQKIGNFAITESRNDRFSHLTLQKTVIYAEMVRITERKRLGQRLQMIICLRETMKNANIGD